MREEPAGIAQPLWQAAGVFPALAFCFQWRVSVEFPIVCEVHCVCVPKSSNIFETLREWFRLPATSTSPLGC